MSTAKRRVDRLEEAILHMDRMTEEIKVQAEKDRQQAEERAEKYRQQAEKDRQQAKQDRRELARQLGDISHKLGTVVEDIIAPSLRRMACDELGCGDELFYAVRLSKTHVGDSGRRREFDAFYVGEEAVMLNESKATARPEYAKSFAQFVRNGEFLSYFPEYADTPIIPVFSSLYLPTDIVTYLTKQGIYAVAMGEDTMCVLNLDQVRTRVGDIG
ncbi:MAG: hypothetical protein ISS49_15575, partial [Anaerolineae bacterium]|nr:hypothetical protein [Anaerolineae bacterium]